MAQDLASLVSSPDWVHWIAGHGDLFHMAFMPARDFGRFARERDIQAEDDDIGQLWTLCLLEADGVWSRRRSARRGLEPVSRTPDGIFYADLRRPRHRSRGWASAATKRTLPPQTLTPLFHPYRYYALARLRRILGGHTALMQTLLYASGHRVINKITLRQFRRHTSSPSFVKDVREWNAVVRLAVLAEPFSFPRMYLRSKASPPQAAEEHQKRVKALYAALSLNDIKELCAAICVEADRLDENRNVYTLLRLAKADLRLKLRGALGGAFLLRGMAEAIRRMAEEAHGTKLPEEDELGFGWAPPDLKLRAYGNNRLFDGDRAAKREFVRQLGADYGSRLRWSVEGDTEEGAARLVVGAAEGSPIEVVNLQGSISEGKKEPTFRRALEADRRHGRFSLVSIDADDVDRVAAVRGAAKSGLIVGQVYLHDPDFELGPPRHARDRPRRHRPLAGLRRGAQRVAGRLPVREGQPAR